MKRIFLLFFFFLGILYSQSPEEEEDALQKITIIPGDTLHKIANLYLLDPNRWPELLKYNIIKSGDPDLIHPGDVLLVPVKEIKKSMRAAHLIEKVNKVDYRPRGESVFKPAHLNQKVLFEDALRTYENAFAKVMFPTKDVLKISPNTLIVVRPKEIEQEIDLLGGEIFARKTKVLTKSAVIEPKEESVFKASVDEERRTKIEVYEGEVDVTGAGKKIELKKGFASDVAPGKIPEIKKIELPPSQELSNLKNDLTVAATFHFEEASVEEVGRFKPEEFSIEKEVKKTEEHRKEAVEVEIAVDRYFAQVVLSGFPKDVEQKIGNLVDGKYFYRVKLRDVLTGESSWGETKSFTISRDAEDFSLVITFPPENYVLYDEFVEVRGSVEGSGVKVIVDSVSAEVKQDGSFSRIIYLPLGPHEIEIVAQDRFGNKKEYRRKIVRKKTSKSFWEKIFGTE